MSGETNDVNGYRRDDQLPSLWDEAAEALPGMARIAAGAWLRSAKWTLGSGVRSGQLLVRTLSDPASAGELVQEVAHDVSEASRVVSEVARAVSTGVPVPRALMDAGATLTGEVVASDRQGDHTRKPTDRGTDQRTDQRTLRERGEELLQRSRDVWSNEEAHPAYARILEDLAPDEARILLLLLRGGPQPSVDVRTGGPVGMVSSQLVAPGLTMIGARAGCRHLDEVPAYLNNLNRLGMVWFSREQLRDPTEYQVVEAQPDVLEAMHSVRFAKVVRRSIHLTPFGVDFCRVCLVDPEDLPGLPVHEEPDGPHGSGV